MAGEFLLKKWGSYFEANDLDKDKFITLNDADIFADRFKLHHSLEGDKARQLKAKFQASWNSLFLFGLEKIDRITYLQMMEYEYTENRATFSERHRRTVRDIIDLFDDNNDGSISEDEYVVVTKCWGIETLDRKFVQSFPQIEPGFICNMVFADAWIDFFINDDESRADIEKPILVGFRLIDQM